MNQQTENFLDKEGEFHYKGHSFYIVYPNSGKSIDDLLDFDVILINALHSEFSAFTIRKLRGFNKSKMYLKPIYFLNPSFDLNSYINSIIDGAVYNLSQLDSIIPQIENILNLNNKVYPNESVSYESDLIMKLLSFNYTRNIKTIKPIPYMMSAINYCYPGLSSSFDYTEEKKIFDILDIAENEGLISGGFYDKTHYCNFCYSGSLNYRSVCPKCNSSNSITQDIIHHFRCGYVGPISDFTNEIDDSLNCPKCNKTLRHIGVDYDKPSSLHTCNSCSNKFQDYDVKAKCLNCEFDNELEVLIEKELKQYSITSKGENAILYGYIAMQKEIQEIIGTVKYEVFSQMTKFEIERMKYSKHSSFVALVNFENTNELISKIGKSNQRDLVKNIVLTVRNFIKPFDLISFRSLSIFVFSINEENEEAARIILNDLTSLLVNLINDNVSNFSVLHTSELLILNTTENYKKQLNKLVNKYE